MANTIPVQGVLGIDPGSRHTGLTFINFDGHIGSAVVIDRTDDSFEPYLLEISEWLKGKIAHGCLVAIEGVEMPKAYFRGKKQMLPVASIMGTCEVLGAMRMLMLERGHTVIIVPPGKNGSGPREAYPPVLWGDREGAAGTGQRRHMRSAYDVALKGLKLASASLMVDPQSHLVKPQLNREKQYVLDREEALAEMAKIREKLGWAK